MSELFPYNAETKAINQRMVLDYAASNRELRNAYFQTRFNELEGNIWENTNALFTFQVKDDDQAQSGSVAMRSSPYFPRLIGEETEVYAERVKIWVPWPSIICKRIANTALRGKTSRKWVASEEGNAEADAIAKRANALHEACEEENDWDTLAHRLYYYAIGVGEWSLWPEFCLYNPKTGEQYKIADGVGLVKYSDWAPWFVEPIITDDLMQDDIGALKIYYFDGQQATPYISRTAGTNEKTIAELYMAPLFDKNTGQILSKGRYLRFENGALIEAPALVYADGKTESKTWSEENFYKCQPVTFFKNCDPDETGIKGKSFVDRFIDLAVQHSQFVSEIGQTISLLPNVWNFDGEVRDIKNIKIRKSKINCNPNPQGKGLYQAARAVDVEPDFKFAEYLSAMIGLAAQFPMQAFNSPQLGGNVESGIALKIVLEPFAEVIGAVRREFAKAEKKVMRVEVMMFNAANKSNPIDITKIRPEISYDENLLPLDMAAELANDISKKAEGAMTDAEFIMKYNPMVTTQDQAEARAKEFRDMKKAAMTPEKKFNFSQINKQPTGL